MLVGVETRARVDDVVVVDQQHSVRVGCQVETAGGRKRLP
ncbi:Uncharacterised protein [Mycobacteroides abscessus subsp. abscessus]|nr:Uncharacterised protein [Mycobacteroides abscessus subsp. abscessus]